MPLPISLSVGTSHGHHPLCSPTEPPEPGKAPVCVASVAVHQFPTEKVDLRPSLLHLSPRNQDPSVSSPEHLLGTLTATLTWCPRPSSSPSVPGSLPGFLPRHPACRLIFLTPSPTDPPSDTENSLLASPRFALRTATTLRARPLPGAPASGHTLPAAVTDGAFSSLRVRAGRPPCWERRPLAPHLAPRRRAALRPSNLSSRTAPSNSYSVTRTNSHTAARTLRRAVFCTKHRHRTLTSSNAQSSQASSCASLMLGKLRHRKAT